MKPDGTEDVRGWSLKRYDGHRAGFDDSLEGRAFPWDAPLGRKGDGKGLLEKSEI